jgi:hypothetical protein
MARKNKNGVNVSEAIRQYLKAHADVGPTDAAKAVSVQVGKKVSPTYVSNIKTTMNGASHKRGRKRRAGRKPSTLTAVTRANASKSLDLATISLAKDLVGRLGSDTAKQLIDLLA